MKDRGFLMLAYGFVLGTAVTTMCNVVMPDDPARAIAIVAMAAILATGSLFVAISLKRPPAQ